MVRLQWKTPNRYWSVHQTSQFPVKNGCHLSSATEKKNCNPKRFQSQPRNTADIDPVHRPHWFVELSTCAMHFQNYPLPLRWYHGDGLSNSRYTALRYAPRNSMCPDDGDLIDQPPQTWPRTLLKYLIVARNYPQGCPLTHSHVHMLRNAIWMFWFSFLFRSGNFTIAHNLYKVSRFEAHGGPHDTARN